MSVSLEALLRALNQTLQPEQFNDYCPNGLQVEGRSTVAKLVTGVTACQALIDRALEVGADAILVHHGYFWKGEDPCVKGMKKQRLAALLKADVSLLAYHLPLDVHPELGNNAQLAQRLNLTVEGGLEPDKANSIGLYGQLPEAIDSQAFSQVIEQVLGRKPLHIAGGDKVIKRVGWCTGSAQGYIQNAIELELDAYITGEVSESTVHTARESGIHFYSAGHHATERYGVQALGGYLAKEFGIEHQFIDIENPV
ncbi:Nif3-like dinuclear metal center hexameric protein [Motiliproteus sp. MSK22-1]|uniref:Nif3-like dinuclear metal center hexameric protein n=1 Tax=Motiliproteus sp. MSK22-1 TaxID=1897630 RepID=UPI000975ABE1|nr:Nif3-like dinuclear metal center hexameric protein [Motiliproteus sp. MSK22-1]OMH30350.1 Nif3-like dinuclear metal center hexameric protein [Motiliproteus sp. MSK22-1]